MKESRVQKEMIDRIVESIQSLGLDMKQDDSTPVEDKVAQMDVLLDTIHFLSDYSENVKVLNSYWIEKRAKEKFKESKEMEV